MSNIVKQYKLAHTNMIGGVGGWAFVLNLYSTVHPISTYHMTLIAINNSNNKIIIKQHFNRIVSTSLQNLGGRANIWNIIVTGIYGPNSKLINPNMTYPASMLLVNLHDIRVALATWLDANYPGYRDTTRGDILRAPQPLHITDNHSPLRINTTYNFTVAWNSIPP